MERADGNRKMWLLKSTSDHHRPECVAAAIALGLLAGLVPKLNLLAVLLYGLIFLLPVHTLLAVAVSVLVSLISWRMDATTHLLGEMLLRQPALRPMWIALDQAPVVPWMSLHNTVVLGNLVIGIVLLAPTYLISLRLFERLEYGGRGRRSERRDAMESYAPVTTEEAEPFTTKKERYHHRDGEPQRRRSEIPQSDESSGDRSPLIVPPPKLHRAVAESVAAAYLMAPDEPILFEPVETDERAQPNGHNVNGWHMHRASGEAQYASIAGESKNASQSAQSPLSSAAANKSGMSQTGVHTTDQDQAAQLEGHEFFPQMRQGSAPAKPGQSSPGGGSQKKDANDSINAGLNERVPPMPAAPAGGLSSLQVAQSAGEVLAWVDDLLDECMAEEGMTLLSRDNERLSNSVFQSQSTSDIDSAPSSDSPVPPRWLLETTIEIVRLTDETMSEQLKASEQSVDCQAQTELLEPRSTENSLNMPSETMTRAWPSVGSVSTASNIVSMPLPMQDANEPTILNLNQAAGRAPYTQLVMADVNKDAESPATLPIEPVKGECLAYLLGHLRQSREGKSS